MRGSSGSFMSYNLLVKCQFKECSAAPSSEPRVHSTFLYFITSLEVTRAIPLIIVRMYVHACVRLWFCVCVCV
jgi:hypothetical protein